MLQESYKGYLGLMVILHEARSDLRMATIGPLNTAIGQDVVFDYFDEIRKVISLASANILFVDPYLDVNFVSGYLPLVKPGVAIRLLAREKLATWVPAAKLFRGNLSCDLRQVFTTAIYLLTGRRATIQRRHARNPAGWRDFLFDGDDLIVFRPIPDAGADSGGFARRYPMAEGVGSELFLIFQKVNASEWNNIVQESPLGSRLLGRSGKPFDVPGPFVLRRSSHDFAPCLLDVGKECSRQFCNLGGSFS
jgi:hypothetical protein